MNKNIVIAFLMGTILTLLVVNYLPKFDIKIEVTEKSEPVNEDKTEKNELSEKTSIVDRLKSKILPEPIPEITADEFLLQNYPDTRISYHREFFKGEQSKGEQSKYKKNRPPKHMRTQTLSKKVGADFLKAQEALNEEKYDESHKILDRLLSNQELSDFERATIYRLKGYVYAEKEDYQKSIDSLQQSLSFNALELQAQLDLQFGIAQLYLAIDQWGNGLREILDWGRNSNSSGVRPGPSFHALLSQIYLYFASKTETGSLAEKQFYEKAAPHAENAILIASKPRENWYQIYLSTLLFGKRYEDARPILEEMVKRFPERDTYKRQLSGLYYKLDVNDGLVPPDKSSQEIIYNPDFGKPQFGAFYASTDADVLPIVKVPPQYPRTASIKGIEGWVLLEFTVTETGATINPKVIDADPPGIFNESALRMIKKWKFKPKIESGKAIQREGVQHLITYELEDKKRTELNELSQPSSITSNLNSINKTKLPELIPEDITGRPKGPSDRCLQKVGGICRKKDANYEERLRVYNYSCDVDPLLKVSVPPEYPARAKQRGIEGWALVEYTVTKTGNVINPLVIDADPPGIFNRAALRSFVKFKYLPAKKNCQKIETKKVQRLATWELEDKK